jgi:WD40 repeat protein
MLVGPHGYVTSVDLCAIDGETLAVTGGNDGVMFLWDAATGSRRWEIPAHDGRISDVRFLPMAETTVVISAGEDAVLRVWDVRSKRQLVEFTGHTGQSVSVATGTVGGCAVVISADSYGEIWAWNPADGGALQNFVLPPAAEDDGAKRSGRIIAAVGFGIVQGEPAVAAVKTNGELVCWRYADAEILGHTRCQHRSEYMHITAAFSSGTGPLTALLGNAGFHWELWEPSEDLAGPRRLPIQRPEAVSVHGTVAVAVRGEALELWDLAKRAVIKRTRCTAPHSSASALLEMADGHLAAVGGNDGRVRIYDLPNAVPFPFAGPGIARDLTSVAIGDTGASPLAAVGGHHVTVLDIDTGDEVRRWPESFDWIRNVRFGTVDDRPVIVSGDDRGFMTVRRADRDRTVAKWFTGHGWALGLAVGRLGDRDVAVTGGQGSEVHVRDLATGDSLGKFSVVSSGQVVDLHLLRSGGRTLLVAAGTANRAIWDLESRQHVADVGFPMTFHPIAAVRRRTGDRLVGIGYDQEICYVDLSDGSVTGVGEDCRIDRSIDENASLSVAASPFGDLAVFASSDGVVDTWNLGAAAAVSSIRFDQPVLSLDTTWDERRQRLLAVVGLPNGAACVSFAVDG